MCAIECSCGMKYKRETCCPLKIIQQEDHETVTRGETEKSDMTYHIWRGKSDHLLDEVEMTDREHHWKMRKHKYSAHMLGHKKLLRRPSIGINTIWEPVITRKNEFQDKASHYCLHVVSIVQVRCANVINLRKKSDGAHKFLYD